MANNIPDSVLYLPGNEPTQLKARLDRFFEKLDGAYADKVVSGLQKDHKKWAETLTELYRLLGYPNGNAMLEAYGYTVVIQKTGRKAQTDLDAFLDELKKRYPNGSDCKTVAALIEANPDLKGGFQFLNQHAKERFDKTPPELLRDMGILTDRPISATVKKADEAMLRRQAKEQEREKKKQAIASAILELKKKYPEGFFGTLQELEAKNPDLLPADYKTTIKEVYSVSAKSFFSFEGILKKKNVIKSDYSGYTQEELLAEKHYPVISDFTWEDLAGKGVLVCSECVQGLIDMTLADAGAVVKRDMSKNVEYIVFKKPYICPISRRNIDAIDILKNKEDFPKFIDDETLLEISSKLKRQGIRDEYKDETLDQKVDRAKRIFDQSVLEIHQMMKKMRTYQSPVAEHVGVLKYDGYTDVYREGLDLFFDYVTEHYKTHSIKDTYCDDPTEIRKELESTFQRILSEEKLDNCSGVRLPVAAAIALKVFVDESVIISTDFVCGTWDPVRDPRSEWRVRFALDPYYDANGTVTKSFVKLKDVFSVPYTEATLEDLNGKNVLILCGDLKMEASELAKKYGAVVKRDISDEIDYIITTLKSFNPDNKTKAAIIDYMTDEKNAEKAPLFVDHYKLRDEARLAYWKSKQDETSKEKLKRAIQIFDTCIAKMNTEIRWDRGYAMPGVDENYQFLAAFYRNNNIDMSAVGNFFDHVAKHYDKYDMYDWDYSDSGKLRKELDDIFNTMRNSDRWSIGGCVGLRLPVALAIASFVFVDPNADIDLNFARDKWERRGDYHSPKQITLRLSAIFDEGKVYWKTFKPWDF